MSQEPTTSTPSRKHEENEQPASKRWTHFHSALHLAIQRAAYCTHDYSPPLRPLGGHFSTLSARLETLEHLPLRHLQLQGPKTQSLWSIAAAPGLDWSCDRHPELSIITPSGRPSHGCSQCQTQVQKARRSHDCVPVIVCPHVS